jgi:hypothetical protein
MPQLWAENLIPHFFSLTPCFSWVTGDAQISPTVSTVFKSKTVETVGKKAEPSVTSIHRGVNERRVYLP